MWDSHFPSTVTGGMAAPCWALQPTRKAVSLLAAHWWGLEGTVWVGWTVGRLSGRLVARGSIEGDVLGLGLGNRLR